MVSKRGGGKQASVMIGKSSSSGGVSTQSLHSNNCAFNQHSVHETPDDFQSLLAHINSPNTYPSDVMVMHRGGKQASVTIGRSSSSSGVSKKSTQYTFSEYIQQTVPGSPDEVVSPLIQVNSSVMMSKRRGKQASVTIGRSQSSSGVTRQTTQPTISEYIQQTVPGSPDEIQSPLFHMVCEAWFQKFDSRY